ncbi:MAG: HNH endonuclease [Chloroflexi bacterium]|nr:HNH endonuclease [Chloroflexota bacterium]
MTRIPVALRREIVDRAGGCCEYCRLPVSELMFALEIDHVIPEKHGGPTTADNLSLACLRCNRRKGSDIVSFDWETGQRVDLYNPRTMRWDDHFNYQEDGLLASLTAIGAMTIKFLLLNTIERVDERRSLTQYGLYPCNPPRQI